MKNENSYQINFEKEKLRRIILGTASGIIFLLFAFSIVIGFLPLLIISVIILISIHIVSFFISVFNKKSVFEGSENKVIFIEEIKDGAKEKE